MKIVLISTLAEDSCRADNIMSPGRGEASELNRAAHCAAIDPAIFLLHFIHNFYLLI